MLADQCLLQLGGESASAFVARHHWIFRRCNDSAEVWQCQVGEIGLGRVGTVEPLGDAQLRQQLFGHLDEASGGNLFLAFGLQASILFLDCLTNCWDAALQRPFGNCALGLWQFGEDGDAMRASRLETLGLRALIYLGRGSEARSRPPIAMISCGAIGRRTGWPCVVSTGSTVGTGLIGGSTPWAFGSTAGTAVGVGARWTIPSVTAIGAIGAIASVASGELLDDRFEGLVARKNFEQSALVGLRLDRRCVEYGGAIELDLDLGAQDVANLRAARKNRRVDRALRHASTSCAPRPSSIGARACEFDLNPAGHMEARYPRIDHSLYLPPRTTSELRCAPCRWLP